MAKLKIIPETPVPGEEQFSRESKEVTLKEVILKIQDWIRYLALKWLLLLFFILAGAAIGFLYALLKKPVYNAELTFVLEDDKAGGLGYAAGLASQFGLDIGAASTSSAFSGDNIIELLKSRALIQKTLLTPVEIGGRLQTLADMYISAGGLRNKWKDDKALQKIQFDPALSHAPLSLKQDSLLGEFHSEIVDRSLTVDRLDKRLSIIALKMLSGNELFAKAFCETLLKNVSQFYVESKTKKEIQNVQILQHQTDSVRRQLNLAISGVASSLDINPNPNPTLQILHAPSQRRQVDVQANTAILNELVRNLEISKVTLRKDTPLIEIIDHPILPLRKTTLSPLKATLAGAAFAGFFVIFLFTLQMVYKSIMA